MTDSQHQTRDPRPQRRSLAERAQGLQRWIGPLLLLAAVLLAAGWLLPIMTIERFLFLSEEVSLLWGTVQLALGGEIFLFAVIFVFSILFPAIKLLMALWIWYRPVDDGGRRRWLDRLEQLGRWSMLDVFIVALVVVAIQLSVVSDVTLHAGLYVFTAAIVLSMLLVRWIAAIAQRVSGAERD